MSLRIGVDIGGTFTDLTVVDATGATQLVWKEDTTPERYEAAIQRGLRAIAGELGRSLGDLLGDVSVFVHGSTIATNTLIERNGPTIGLVTTAGFRDVLYFRDGFKADRYNIRLPHPDPIVDRHLRLGVVERVLADGSVATELDEASVRAAAATLRAQDVAAIAVALLWSHVNPAHERRVREILQAELPDTPILLSSEVLPVGGEWVRTSATALSAYIFPATSHYLAQLEQWLAGEGLPSTLLVMQVSGGCARAEQCLKIPVSLAHSGPAAAPVAARTVAARAPDADSGDVIAIDMGGTSFDVTLIQQGAVPVERGMRIDDQPIGVPAVDLHSIGAGGGSLAWVDSGGALRVGPESAGSTPGPAAYGNGGTRPTVTDANLVLGYLPETLLGGRKRLSRELAVEAIRAHVAEPMGLTVEQAAAGILRVVDEDMTSAMRAVSIERGIDPRGYLVVAGGGAGGLHAARLTRGLGIRQMMVPAESGGLSAYGMTVTDVRHDYAFALHTKSDAPDLDAVRAGFDRLERQALADLEAGGLPADTLSFERTVDARYVGQAHSLMTALPSRELDAAALAELRERFDAAHQERYTFALPDATVEFLNWRLVATAKRHVDPAATFAALPEEGPAAEPSGSRSALFAPYERFADTPTYAAAELPAGATLTGPAIVDSDTSTIVVPPGDRLVADGRGSFLVTIDVAAPDPSEDPDG
jgi:N-methylhydantoinase A